LDQHISFGRDRWPDAPHVADSQRFVKPGIQSQRPRGAKGEVPFSTSTEMNDPDQDMILRAVEDARRILGEYIAPGPHDAMHTVERLLAVLDKDDLLRSLDRMQRRRTLRLVE
jgi:hypothetical protein